MSIYVPTPAKAALGPGAAAWLTQPMAPWVGGGGYSRPQKFMRQCAAFWKSDPWIRAAERVISGKFSTVEWVLEDANDAEIDDEYPDKRYLQPRDLMEQPQRNLPSDESQHLTRREIWNLTCRHMGVTGNAFWYLDKLESQARTPLDILYIAPWRMWPVPDSRGNLVAWMLDWNEQTNSGTRLELDEVIHFTLEPPEEGFYGIGLVETAMTLATLDKVAMNHAIQVLQSGGRLAGIVAPKDAASALPDDKFQQLVRDFRTINELPDAAKRLNILQGPVDFLPTAANMHDLLLKDLLTLDRDFILELWGVPLSQIGGSAGGGLNSGETKKYDEAALWQGAIHPRLVAFSERVQFDLLDRYQKLGITVEFEIEEPAFDDDGPRFDLLAKSAGTPMRNFERRALINLEPFGDVALDNAVWMPSLTTEAFIAPDENGVIVPSAMPELPQPPAPMVIAPGAMAAPGPVSSMPLAKAPLPPRMHAVHSALTKLRSRMEREHTSTLTTSLADFLQKQKQDIASRLRANAEHISRKPRETDAWFAKARWDRELTSILERPLTAMAQNVNEHIQKTLQPKAAPAGVVDRALARGAARVTGINEKTRAAVQTYLVAGLEQGLSPAALADEMEAGVLLDNGSPVFDELRAETIARTELMDAYNGAAIASYDDAGVSEVQAIDGDGDEECAARDGETFSLEEADSIEDHPNGTLDWVPIIPDESPVKSAEAPDIPALLRAAKAEAVTLQVVNGEISQGRTIIDRDYDGRVIGSHVSTRQVRTVIDRDPDTGRVSGSHEEYVSDA